jgi:hypothetical protein
VSRKCRLPFTHGVIYPVLVIPYEAKDWPEEKFRAVLIHELAHICRYDYAVILFSRLICALFWFIPVVWVARSRLQLEQENICDLMAIQKGERPTAYVRYMIDLARAARSLVTWSAIFIMKGRNKNLEKRVTNVLNLNRSAPQGESKMKVRTLITTLTLVFAVLIVVSSYATEREAISNDDFFKVWSGTWVNTELKGGTGAEQKILFYPDGTWKQYTLFTDTSSQCEGINIFSVKEIDSNGDIWYTCRWKCMKHGTEKFEMGKISNSGNTLELIYTSKLLSIEEWDPDNIRYTYRIYSRQE